MDAVLFTNQIPTHIRFLERLDKLDSKFSLKELLKFEILKFENKIFPENTLPSLLMFLNSFCPHSFVSQTLLVVLNYF